MVNGWDPPIACSRTGTAHRRRGTPCQDSTAAATLHSSDGLPVQVMAVADGHGSRQHPLSAVGSRLACEAALLAVGRELGGRALAGSATPEGRACWLRWLAGELPAALHADWLAAIRRDWVERCAAGAAGATEPAEDFSALPYGSTLGLVVMTPLWWGCTGLGDWDLVRVDSSGTAQLVSEEVLEPGGGGDRTCSLCQQEAPTLCAGRGRLHPLPPQSGGGSFALVLCTDGIRKGCATDADFLALSAWLAEGTLAGEELAGALDRISAEGSGDDVSVAMATFRPGAAADLPLNRPTPSVVALSGRRPGRTWAVGAAVAALAALAAGVLALRHRPPPGDPAVHRLVQDLCRRTPQEIAGTLSSRRRQFEDLRRGRSSAVALRSAARQDPLGALIAASFAPSGPTMGERPVADGSLCPALREALRRQWRQLDPPPSPPPPSR
ncbi:MAG: protein phosphatase 2C domain-containing protein [Synechococcaceae cyanobacterium]|nr:protein phosphatase 2C domain-containing protein [Synechococcaceae cyanobacterium]